MIQGYGGLGQRSLSPSFPPGHCTDSVTVVGLVYMPSFNITCTSYEGGSISGIFTLICTKPWTIPGADVTERILEALPSSSTVIGRAGVKGVASSGTLPSSCGCVVIPTPVASNAMADPGAAGLSNEFTVPSELSIDPGPPPVPS